MMNLRIALMSSAQHAMQQVAYQWNLFLCKLICIVKLNEQALQYVAGATCVQSLKVIFLLFWKTF